VVTTLFAQAYAPYLALGIGDLGGRAAAAGCLEGFGEKLPWAACDTQSSRLLATGLERKLCLDLPRALRPEFIGSALKRHEQQIHRLLRKKDLVVLFGALEEPALIPLCTALSQHMRSDTRSVCAIGLEPLLPGTDVPAGHPGEADLFLHVSATSQVAGLGPGISAARLSRLGEETLSFAVEALLAALVGCDSAPGFTFDALHEFLRGGSIGSFVGAAEGREAVLAAFEQALAVCSPEHHHGAAVAMVAGREFSLNEVRTIRTRLTETFGATMPVLYGFGTDPSLGEDARCLLMCRPPSSRNVVHLTR
jgi:hypothetical protein